MWRPVGGFWTSAVLVKLLEADQSGGGEGAVDDPGWDEVDLGGSDVKDDARFGKASEKRTGQKEGTACVIDSEDWAFATSDERGTGDVGAEDVVLSQERDLIEGSDSLKIMDRDSIRATSSRDANPSS